MSSRFMNSPWDAERCARLLSKAKKSPNGWKACCPAHEDDDPSLFLADGKDGIALVCYAGCDYHSIVQALEAKGAIVSRSSDRTTIPDQHFSLGPYHSFWDYRSAHGALLMRICRWELPDGKKEIRPLSKHIDGWKWLALQKPRPLYNLDRLAAEVEKPVIIVEGEKTASAAQKLFPSHIATTWPGGAAAMGEVDFTPLLGRNVVLIPDCDDPGRKAMEWVSTALHGIASTVCTIDPASIVQGLCKGWDLADALAEGRDVSEWLAPAAPAIPRLVQLGFTVNEARVHLELPYLVKDLCDRGQIIVMWGSPGSGKTFVALHLAAHIGAGVTWAGRRVKRGQVLYVCAESTRLRLENRVAALRSAYAELVGSQVLLVPVQLDLLHGQKDIADVIAAAQHFTDIALVVVDTLSVTFGGGNENAPEDMGAYVSNLKRIREATGAAVLIVHHSGKDELKGMRGHSALLGALDAELSVEKLEAAPGWPSRMLKAGKLREGLSNSDVLPFDLEVRSLGSDSDGDAVTTCTVRPASTPGGSGLRRPSMKTQIDLLGSLERSYREGTKYWTEKAVRDMAGALMHRNSVTGALMGLLQLDFIRRTVGGIMLTYPPEDSAQ